MPTWVNWVLSRTMMSPIFGDGGRWVWLALALALWAGGLLAQTPVRPLGAQDLGLLINTADPYSVAVGEYYAQQRGIAPEQVLRVILPLRPVLSESEFKALDAQVRAHMGPQVQALAVAWTQPYAVECNSITAALSLGFEPQLCQQTCAPSKPSPYFNTDSSKPFSQLGVRPSMLLASRSIASGRALIDRGLAADHQLGRLGGPPAQAVFVSTPDKLRNVRAALFPPAGLLRSRLTEVVRLNGEPALPAHNVVLLQTGAAQVGSLDRMGWLPGALADHLTSFGGRLLDSQGQMSALDWLEAGATASYGTVSEPCNHVQKFPHPQVVLANYLRGKTALEAYWRSVAWPAQGVFIGEPLAAPYARKLEKD